MEEKYGGEIKLIKDSAQRRERIIASLLALCIGIR